MLVAVFDMNKRNEDLSERKLSHSHDVTNISVSLDSQITHYTIA